MSMRGLRVVRASAFVVLLTSSTALAQSPPKTADYSQEAFVIEQARTTFRFEKDGTGQRDLYMRVKAQTAAGVQQWGQVVVGYNSANERLEIAFVRVRKPDGLVVSTPLTAVQELTSPVERIAPVYTDFRQKHITVQSLGAGDTLEFSVVTTVHTPVAVGHFWSEYDFQHDAIVLDEQLDIDVPADVPLKLETRPGFDPRIEDAAGRRRYHWRTSNLTRPVEDPKQAKKASLEPAPPAVRLTTFQSWEQVGRWYASLESTQKAPTPEIRAKAQALTAGLSTDLEKIEALYRFVSSGFRYVSLSLGMGRYQPRLAADVLRDQYGDCKDKHTLLASLIAASGLRASAVLINSRLKLDPDFPSPSQFDHVITKAMANGEPVWLDSTSEVAPFRLLAFPLRRKQALVIDDEGAPRLEETPADPPFAAALKEEVDATLSSSGKLTGRFHMQARGDTELLFRAIFRAAPAAQWKQIFDEIARQEGVEGEVSDWHVSDPAATKDPFTFDFSFSAPGFVDWAKKTVELALPFGDIAFPASEEGADDDPVKLGALGQASYALRLELPAGSNPRVPVPVTIARDYAEYRGAYTLSGTLFTAERVLRTHASELPAARRQDYAAFARVISGDSKQLLSLEAPAGLTTEASTGLETRELNRRGYDALYAGNLTQAVTLLKRVTEIEPRDRTAWNNLGLAYLALRQVEPAIDAFRKQIDVNAYDEYAYNNLGRAYVIQRKYDDAEAAFRKQLEVNPLDKYAHGNIGSMYLERSQYERAASELEQAIAIAPDNSGLRVDLGKAYLGTKQNDRAMAAFDKAVELAPSPVTWNNIAYELSKYGVDLERAERYAESAVTAMTATSRNIDLDHVDVKALAVVLSLGAYWDTLGWVRFARGDIAGAEPLVAAAWRLTEHSEVGDHLAQIYEKLGRREDAIRAYAMALGAQRPSEDTRARLARLVGPNGITAAVTEHRSRLAALRTEEVSLKGHAGQHADFFVLFASPSALEDVRFAEGDEALRAVTDVLRKVQFAPMFPDSTPAKVVRRGILACPSAGTSCAFTLLLPEDARPAK